MDYNSFGNQKGLGFGSYNDISRFGSQGTMDINNSNMVNKQKQFSNQNMRMNMDLARKENQRYEAGRNSMANFQDMISGGSTMNQANKISKIGDNSLGTLDHQKTMQKNIDMQKAQFEAEKKSLYANPFSGRGYN